MFSDWFPKNSQAQRGRLAFVIAQYQELAPHNLEYNPKGKVSVRASWFRPLFDFPAERVLAWLSEGGRKPIRWRGVVSQEGTASPDQLDLELLSVLARAFHRNAAVGISYRALSSGLTTRRIVPFVFADNSLRWHVRAFDRRSGEFRDFVLGRLDDACIVDGAVTDYEKPDQDIQRNRVTELMLVPHPTNVQHPDTIEVEYGMENGVFKARVRAAMAGYLLCRRYVDGSAGHSLIGLKMGRNGNSVPARADENSVLPKSTNQSPYNRRKFCSIRTGKRGAPC